MKRGMNVGMEGFKVHVCGCSEGGCIISEHWPKIVRVNSCISPFPLFRVDVPSSSQCVQFGSKFSEVEMNHKVNCDRNSEQWACRCVRTLVVEKYSRFLWSVMMSILRRWPGVPCCAHRSLVPGT